MLRRSRSGAACLCVVGISWPPKPLTRQPMLLMRRRPRPTVVKPLRSRSTRTSRKSGRPMPLVSRWLRPPVEGLSEAARPRPHQKAARQCHSSVVGLARQVPTSPKPHTSPTSPMPLVADAPLVPDVLEAACRRCACGQETQTRSRR